MARNAALEESFVSFSKYLQENDAKKARASKRAIDEACACEERTQEAENLVYLIACKSVLQNHIVNSACEVRR